MRNQYDANNLKHRLAMDHASLGHEALDKLYQWAISPDAEKVTPETEAAKKASEINELATKLVMSAHKKASGNRAEILTRLGYADHHMKGTSPAPATALHWVRTLYAAQDAGLITAEWLADLMRNGGGYGEGSLDRIVQRLEDEIFTDRLTTPVPVEEPKQGPQGGGGVHVVGSNEDAYREAVDRANRLKYQQVIQALGDGDIAAAEAEIARIARADYEAAKTNVHRAREEG